MLLKPLEITTPIGCFNGGVIARPDLSVITALILPSQVARCALDMLRTVGCSPGYSPGPDWLMRDSEGPYVGLEERTVEFGPTVVRDFGPTLS